MDNAFANPNVVAHTAPPAAPADIFKDLDTWRIAPEEDFLAGATKAIQTVEVQKPKSNVWFRTDMTRTLTTTVCEDKETRQFFLVTREMAPKLKDQGALTLATLVPFINRSKDVGLWPVKHAADGSGTNLWHKTAAEAARVGSKQWTRMFADMAHGGYRIQVPVGEFPDPEWPEHSMSELLELGFKDRVIANDDHPVMNQLLGRV